ncbi:MAG: hypothetical protein ACXVCE_14135 [Bacteriovorax sp.]
MNLLLSFFGAQAIAESLIEVTRNNGGVIFLNGPSCQELVQQERALRLWTLNSGETPGPIASPLESSDHSHCQLVINNSIPTLARSLQSFKTAFNGPNCWNTSLRLSGLTSFARFSTDEEMSFWMSSPYCRELSSSDSPLPGDIIAIRAEKEGQPKAFEEIHGMIYLSEDLAFSKNTSSTMSPYSIQRASLIYQNFRLTSSQCMRVQGHPDSCPRWANHYRCVSSEKDWASLEKESPEFASLSAEVRNLESQFSDYVMNGQGPYGTNKEKIPQQLTELEAKIAKAQKTSGTLGKIDFFLKALQQKIHSLQVQVEILNKKSHH